MVRIMGNISFAYSLAVFKVTACPLLVSLNHAQSFMRVYVLYAYLHMFALY